MPKISMLIDREEDYGVTTSIYVDGTLTLVVQCADPDMQSGPFNVLTGDKEVMLGATASWQSAVRCCLAFKAGIKWLEAED